MAKKEDNYSQAVKAAIDAIGLCKNLIEENDRLRLAIALLEPLPKRGRGRPKKQPEILSPKKRGRKKIPIHVSRLEGFEEFKVKHGVKSDLQALIKMGEQIAAKLEIRLSKARAPEMMAKYKTIRNQLARLRNPIN